MRAQESVTLLCLDTRDPDLAVLAMQRCMAGIRFAEAILLTHESFRLNDPRITVRPVEKLQNIDDYSHFMVKEIGNHFSTSHVLVVQWDGFVLDSTRWEDVFLNYDYVGAPWANRRHAVGNGGFSLRSRKLVNALRDPRIIDLCPEDYAICDRYHDLLVSEYGIHFAPLAVASRFSCEMIEPQQPTFGVHGVGTLHWVMTDHVLLEHLKTIPNHVLLGQVGRTLAKDCINEKKLLSAKYILTIRSSQGSFAQRLDTCKLYIKMVFRQPSNSRHLIYNAFGAGDYLNNLRGEFDEIPAALRSKWERKCRQRSWLLMLTGQSFLEQQKIPAGVRKILWFYDWNTLGDSIMDLSQRQYLSDRYQVDICMPSGPAELFAGDRCFGHVYTDINQCPQDYDFILLHDISSRSIGIKLRRYFTKPWASMIRHQQGEQHARGALSAFRFGQLLGLPDLVPLRPTIASGCPQSNNQQIRVAVALGGGDPRRSYKQWPALLNEIRQSVDKETPMRFVLVGSGQPAQEDLKSFSADFLAQNCEVCLDLPNLLALRDVMCSATHFLGCDSGLMHLAEALDKPGVALFGHIRPEWRLLPDTRLRALFSMRSVNQIAGSDIFESFIKLIQAEGNYAS